MLQLKSFFILVPVLLYFIYKVKTGISNGENVQVALFSIDKCNIIKGIMAILIVITHIGNEITANGLRISTICNWGGVCVSTFFFISGYGLMLSYKKKGTEYLNSFFRKRLLKLLPPFLIATFVWIFIKVFLYGYDISGICVDFANGAPPLPNSWFVYIIILLYAVFYASMRIDSKLKRGGIFIALILVFLITIIPYSIGWGIEWYGNTMAFFIGMVWAKEEKRIRDIVQRHRVGILILTLTICLIYMAAIVLHIEQYFPLRYSWIVSATIAVTCYFIKDRTYNYILIWLGTISFEIYLIHGIFLYVFNPMIDHTTLYFILCISVTVTLSWILHYVCGRIKCQ